MAIICLISFIIFSILGIFSLHYRNLAKEAFKCFMGRNKNKKCEASIDKKIKATLIGKVSRINPKLAKYLSKYFIIFFLIFILILSISFFFTVKSIYNYINYGNCNGKNSNDFCVISDLNNLSNSNCFNNNFNDDNFLNWNS